MNPDLISADEIKKTLKDYHPSKVEKFHHESARIADKDFEEKLKTNKEKDVVLLCGGMASGKTEFYSEFLQDFGGIVFDGTLSNPLGAKIKLNKVFKANKRPIVYGVLSDDLERSYIAFLNRERRFENDTRFYETHMGARLTLLWIAINMPKVKIKIIESFYSKKNTVNEKDLKFERVEFKSQSELIEFLKSVQYTEEEVTRLIKSKI